MLGTLSSEQFMMSPVSLSYYDFHFLTLIIIGIFSLVGTPISAKTLHCPEFAVVDYSFTQGILCFYQHRRVNNPG